MQGDAIALPDLEGEGRADGSAAIDRSDLIKAGQNAGVVHQRMQLQIFCALRVFEQLGFLLDGLFLPRLDGFGALHHLCGFMPDKAFVCRAAFGCLHAIRPRGALPGGGFEPFDIAPEPLILRGLGLLLLAEVFYPGGEIAALHLDIGPIQGKNVIDAGIEETAIVRDQNKALFLLQISGDDFPGPGIQMIGWLIDEQEAPFL